MKLRTLIIAALILIALGTYIFVVEIIGGKESESTQQWGKKLFKLSDWNEVKSIEIWNYQQHVVFENLGKDKDGEEVWQIRKPVDWPADRYNFDSILSTLEFIEIDKKLSSKGKNLSEFGLDRPPRIIVVKTSTKSLELLVGELSPVGDSVYVKYPDSEDIFMVSAILDRQLKRPPFYFFDKSIFRAKKADIKTVEYELRGKPLYKIEKEESGWQLKYPGELAVDSEEMDKLLSKIEELKISAIAADATSSLEAYGLASPEKVLRISTMSGEARALLVSSQLTKEYDKFFAKRDSWPQLLEIDKDALDGFDLAISQLRDKKITHLDIKEVKEIAFVFPDRELKVWQTEDSHWHVEPIPKGKTFSEFWASNLGLHALKEKAAEFVSDSPTSEELERWGLTKPMARVEIRAKNGRIDGFKLGAQAGEDRRYAQLLSGPVIILEDPEMHDFLEPDKTLWENKTTPEVKNNGKGNR